MVDAASFLHALEADFTTPPLAMSSMLPLPPGRLEHQLRCRCRVQELVRLQLMLPPQAIPLAPPSTRYPLRCRCHRRSSCVLAHRRLCRPRHSCHWSRGRWQCQWLLLLCGLRLLAHGHSGGRSLDAPAWNAARHAASRTVHDCDT